MCRTINENLFVAFKKYLFQQNVHSQTTLLVHVCLFSFHVDVLRATTTRKEALCGSDGKAAMAARSFIPDLYWTSN